MRAAPRRSSIDERWQRVKAIVDKRDRSCRALRCMTLAEAKMVEKIPNFSKRRDRAHLLSAGSHPRYIYCPENVYKISHTLHERLDNYQDLVTGEPIDSNQRYWWAWRIATSSTEKYDENVDYELELHGIMKTGLLGGDTE